MNGKKILSDGSGVYVSYSGALQVIQFNNQQKRNAWNTKSYQKIREALAEGKKRDDVTVTVFTHQGKVYSAGNDFSAALKPTGDPLQELNSSLDQIRSLIDDIIDYPKLLVAVLDGAAVGIACTTLALFDLVFASENSSFYTPFGRLALLPEGCSSYTFPRLMGNSKAGVLLYLGEKITARQAEQCGLIAESFFPSQKELVMSRVKMMSTLPRQALKSMKRLVSDHQREHLHRVNHKEMQALQDACLSEEFFNAVASSFRKPPSKM